MKHLREIAGFGKVARANALHVRLSNHFNYDNVDPHDRKASWDYQGGSGELNHYLWEKHKGTKPSEIKPTWSDRPIPSAHIDQHEKDISQLDHLMTTNKTPHKMVVYSGTPNDPRDHMNESGIVHHPAYLSTSLDQNIGEKFSREKVNRNDYSQHLLKIHVPKDHPAAFIPNLHPTAFSSAEKEVLLPRGINLQHMKTTSTTSKTVSGGSVSVNVHHMRVVP